jgi:predicted RNA-binding Zn-ribbon protein involved in translation (DUF1610 family)
MNNNKTIEDYDNLEDCPNCGGVSLRFETDSMCSIRIKCEACGISGPPSSLLRWSTEGDKDEAVVFWNKLRRYRYK